MIFIMPVPKSLLHQFLRPSHHSTCFIFLPKQPYIFEVKTSADLQTMQIIIYSKVYIAQDIIIENHFLFPCSQEAETSISNNVVSFYIFLFYYTLLYELQS